MRIHQHGKLHTTAYLSAQPNPIGVGQQMEIVMAINWVMPGALIQNDIRPHGYILTITKPDGTNETTTYDPYDSGDSRFILYTPNQVGNYTLEFVYPGEVYHYPNYTATHPGIPVSAYYNNDIYENDTFLRLKSICKVYSSARPSSKIPRHSTSNRVLDTPSIRNELCMATYSIKLGRWGSPSRPLAKRRCSTEKCTHNLDTTS